MITTKKKNTKKLDKLRKSGFNDIRIVEIIEIVQIADTKRHRCITGAFLLPRLSFLHQGKKNVRETKL
jgi:tRNA A58 N-methylase Trm61